jgi:hypothetical protein
MKCGRSGWIVLVCCFCLVTVSTSCSISFMNTVPMQWTPGQKVKCDGYALPVIDTVLTLLLGGAIATGMVEYADEEGVGRTLIGLMSITPFYFLAGSAVTGWYWGSECHQAESLRDDWLEMGPVEQERIEERWREKKDVPPMEEPP